MKNDFLAFSRQKSTSLSFGLNVSEKSLFAKVLKFEKVLNFYPSSVHSIRLSKRMGRAGRSNQGECGDNIRQAL